MYPSCSADILLREALTNLASTPHSEAALSPRLCVLELPSLSTFLGECKMRLRPPPPFCPPFTVRFTFGMDPATLGPSLTLCGLRSAFVGPINHLLPLVNMLSISCSHMLRLLGKLFHLTIVRGRPVERRSILRTTLDRDC